MDVAETSMYLYLKLKSITLQFWILLLVAGLLGSAVSFQHFDLPNWGAGSVSLQPQATAPVMPAVVKPDYQIPPVANGLAPVVANIPTKQPVVFLTIDDGLHKDAKQLKMLQLHHIKASLFLDNEAIKDNPKFFRPFLKAGLPIESHTLTHPHLPDLTYDQQKEEICGQADMEARAYGRRPILFRPPYGEYNTDTQRATADCGMKAVVVWVAKANGGSMQYQVGESLQPGDIVLMHFRPEFQSDMQAFIDAQNAAGLHTELLENWLP